MTKSQFIAITGKTPAEVDAIYADAKAHRGEWRKFSPYHMFRIRYNGISYEIY
jgi:hypothetical protein